MEKGPYKPTDTAGEGSSLKEKGVEFPDGIAFSRFKIVVLTIPFLRFLLDESDWSGEEIILFWFASGIST